ncbi:MAG: flagellar hook-basal body protein [Verrucomicrobiales bacterium]|nr:flagellar hook-basal body protein [Verrucomicrobiales bacterium]
MNVSLYQAASAMNATDRWQETIAENLAASSIAGFKKQEFSFAGIAGGALHHSGTAPLKAMRHVLMPHGVSSTSFQQGALRATNNQTDLAIEGAAFFEVQLPNGAAAYTRDGEFHISAQGQLVTKEGYLILGNGGPIQLDLNNAGALTVSSTGDISQGSDLKGRLNLIEFNDPKLLARLSNGYFAPKDPNLNSEPSRTTTVRQGFLEAANTSPVTEMVSLISAMRTFEANQRVAQLHDERTGRMIQELTV